MTSPDTPEPEPPISVHVALARVMAELPAIGKLTADEHAARTGRPNPERSVPYSYRGIDQITQAAQHLFATHGVVVIPSVQAMRIVDIVVGGKPWTDTILEVDYSLIGPDGSTLTARTVGIGRDNSDKGANKAMTQAFKYLLLQVLCISDAKDDVDGATHEADAAAPAEPAEPLDPELVERARKVYAAALELDDDGKADLKAWKGDRKIVVSTMADDVVWLEAVESWFAGRAFLEGEGEVEHTVDPTDDELARRRALAEAKRSAVAEQAAAHVVDHPSAHTDTTGDDER